MSINTLSPTPGTRLFPARPFLFTLFPPKAGVLESLSEQGKSLYSELSDAEEWEDGVPSGLLREIEGGEWNAAIAELSRHEMLQLEPIKSQESWAA